MALKGVIEHAGVVTEIKGSHLKVEILQVSACASCESRKHCYASDMKNKIIDVCSDENIYQVGDKVKVQLRQDLAWKALTIAYMVPFLLVLMTLLIVYALTQNELTAGLSAIMIIVPYFIIIRLIQNKLQRIYTFTLIKNNE